MPLFRPSLLRCAAASTSTSTSTSISSTRLTAREALRKRTASPSSSTTTTTYPTIPTCPSPSCPCAEMPPDLDIDKSIDLNGTMAPYAEHLVIPSGQDDWTSKIEDERDTAPWGNFTARVKHALSQKGEFHDPYRNIVVSTCSFSPPSSSSSNETEKPTSRALLFPSFRIVEDIRSQSTEDTADFIRTFLLPEKLHPSQHASLSEDEKRSKTRDPSSLTTGYWKGKVRPISSPTVLICSHNSRDSRCGILGPLLHAEFTSHLNKRASLTSAASASEGGPGENGRGKGTPRSNSCASHPEFEAEFVEKSTGMHPVNVGMISHIGGHKFAGNVIVYIPPDHPRQDGEAGGEGTKSKESVDPEAQKNILHDDEPRDFVSEGLHPLAGKGIWYGRVEPRHVEGIVEQTIGQGNIIKELFRGGVNHDGSSIRLGLY